MNWLKYPACIYPADPILAAYILAYGCVWDPARLLIFIEHSLFIPTVWGFFNRNLMQDLDFVFVTDSFKPK